MLVVGQRIALLALLLASQPGQACSFISLSDAKESVSSHTTIASQPILSTEPGSSQSYLAVAHDATDAGIAVDRAFREQSLNFSAHTVSFNNRTHIDNTDSAHLPEPAEWALTTFGLGFLGFALRRKGPDVKASFS